MFEKIMAWINKIALINIVTPRRALYAYLKALRTADLDGNGELNAKEVIKSTKTRLKELVFSNDATDEEIHELVDKILARKV